VFNGLHDELGWRARRHSYGEAPKSFFYLGTRILGYLKHSIAEVDVEDLDKLHHEPLNR
jgi:hypothetical protein